jgi:glycosyltransferase involved in cell wall biosynthesis
MPSPKVLYVLDHYPVLSQTFVAAEVDGLRAKGWTIDVVSTRPSSLGHQAVPSLQRMAWQVPWWHLWYLVRSPRRYFAMIRSVLTGRGLTPWNAFVPLLARVIERDQPDIVHTHFALRSAALLGHASRLLDFKRSVTTHAIDIYANNPSIRVALEGAVVVTISERNRQRLIGDLGINSVDVVYCGVEFPPDIQATNLRDIDLLAVGRMVPKKGFSVLIDALEIIQSEGLAASTVFVGEGNLREGFEQAVTDRGLADVRFVGAMGHRDAMSMMDRSKVLVVPSVVADDGDQEGIPVVILEAMARGAAVVTTRTGSIDEVINNNTGWLVSPGDAGGLALAIIEALQGPESRARRCEEARRTVRNGHSSQDQIDGMSDVFVRMADSQS